MSAGATCGTKLNHYDFGATTYYACQSDPRFGYCAYVPEGYEEAGDRKHRLLVVVHGTERGVNHYRDRFADVAEATGCIVLAPLFPAGITAPGELSSYKMIRAGSLRYDHVLLSMIDEMAARYRLRDDGFCLYGFSGGGHFAHRFYYLHPERLHAVSIGAPGVVTLLDFDRDFWVGVRGFADVFGKEIDLDAMRRVQVQTVVGEHDTETWEITLKPEHPWWMEGADLAGVNRQDRIAALGASLERHGIAVQADVAQGAAHRGADVLEPVKAFLTKVMADDQH